MFAAPLSLKLEVEMTTDNLSEASKLNKHAVVPTAKGFALEIGQFTIEPEISGLEQMNAILKD